MDPLDQPATAEHLRRLAAHGLLSPSELELALARTGHLPSPRAWARFANLALLLAGAALLVAGIFFFFAYNWADLHRFAKFGLVQGAVLVALGYALWRGLGRTDAQVALFVACALVGPLLGVFGQVYQTGADSYGLFLVWSIFILVPAALARNAPLWMLLIALLNITLGLTWEQRVLDYYDLLNTARFALGAVALGGWELARSRGAAWMRSPWYGRALLVAAAFWGCVLVFDAISVGWYLRADGIAFLPVPLTALGLGAAAAYYYWRRSPDLPALSVLALCAISVVTAQLLHWIGWDSVFGFLFVGVLVLVQVGGATLLLLGAARKMEVAR